MDAILPKSWNVDQIINDLDQQGFTIIDDAYPADYILRLVEECSSNLNRFRDAAIQNGVVSNIRSDHILWINEQLQTAQQHVSTLFSLAEQLNRAFFTGIRDVEAHFACYNQGEFYALHRDNPQNRNGRVFSAVIYLHESWQNDWGGQLHLQDKNGLWHTLQPTPNRIAIFQSDLLHEVLKAQQQRLSITAWMRNDAAVI